MKTSSIKSIVAMALIIIATAACEQEPAAVAPEKFTLVGNVYTTDVFRYEGDIRDGKPNGKGVITFNWGDKYDGEVVNANPNGEGVMRYVDGSIYRGHFKDGRPNGQGRMDTPDGGWYKGSWKDGNRNGQGTLMVNGIRQTGIFENDQPKKVAILNLSNCLKGDCRSGYGVERTGEGTYSGEFVDGEFHGQGTYKYSNGDVYKGSFLKGCKYGAGVITSPSGKYVMSGIFEKDKWVEGTKQYSDGTPSLIMIRSIL